MKTRHPTATPATLDRRRLLLGGGAALAALVPGCDRGVASGGPSDRRAATAAPPPRAGSETASGPADRWQMLDFPASAERAEPELAALLEAPGKAADTPLLVALHGRGEAGRGLPAGARGWRDDYALAAVEAALFRGKLDEGDLRGFVRPERLARLNASLAAAPFRGLAVACPYTPALADRSFEGSAGFARFVIGELVPAARRALGLAAEPGRTGIDGVSMGGRLALFVGLGHPEAFGAVGALQPAIYEDEAPFLSELAARAQGRGQHPLRLVTSDDDGFRAAVEALGRRLDRDKVRHELVLTPGPHDYAWNRGPGGVEMLLWHERVLRGLPGP
ncbi:MAG: esterase [Myxococcales bacterium]|nr:esterase [Myxococcales bacterium]